MQSLGISGADSGWLREHHHPLATPGAANIQTATDTDGDGMSDAWETMHG